MLPNWINKKLVEYGSKVLGEGQKSVAKNSNFLRQLMGGGGGSKHRKCFVGRKSKMFRFQRSEQILWVPIFTGYRFLDYIYFSVNNYVTPPSLLFDFPAHCQANCCHLQSNLCPPFTCESKLLSSSPTSNFRELEFEIQIPEVGSGWSRDEDQLPMMSISWLACITDRIYWPRRVGFVS